jgi:hypothetical protein
VNFDLWWNKPEDTPEEYADLIEDVCRAAWKKAREDHRARCGLIAEMYPFSPHIGKQIAAAIYRGEDD